MKTRKYITMMLLLLAYVTAMAQNTLKVGSLTGGQGKDVMIPISMENTDEVVALQFDLQLPFDKTYRKDATLTCRLVMITSDSLMGCTVSGSRPVGTVMGNSMRLPAFPASGRLFMFTTTPTAYIS